MNNFSANSDFCVLLPIYQRQDLEEYFERVVSSCFNGDVHPVEIIVAVDGDLNESFNLKLVSLSSEFPLKVVRAGAKVGLSEVLNIGLEAVTAEYVFRVDGDDFSRKERWHNQLEALKSGFDLVGAAIQEISLEGVPLSVRRTPLKHQEIVSRCMQRNPFNHMTTAYRTSLVKKVGGYPHLYLREDWGLWVNMIACGAKCKNFQEIMVDATTDVAMFRRRGGIKNIMAEISMQKSLVSNLGKNRFRAALDWTLKALILASPAFLREKFYFMFLRD